MAAEAVLNYGAEQRSSSREHSHFSRVDITSISNRLQAAPGVSVLGPLLRPPVLPLLRPPVLPLLGRRRSLHTSRRVPPLGQEGAPKDISAKVPVC